jgi:hypothetical protein
VNAVGELGRHKSSDLHEAVVQSPPTSTAPVGSGRHTPDGAPDVSKSTNAQPVPDLQLGLYGSQIARQNCVVAVSAMQRRPAAHALLVPHGWSAPPVPCAWQVCVPESQTGVEPEQFAFERHCTHACGVSVLSHTEPAGQPAVAQSGGGGVVHAFITHFLPVPHWASVVQATQACVVAVSQWAVGAAHCVSAVHATHACEPVSQWAEPGVVHSASVPQPTHANVVVLHVPDGHWALAVHWTQVPWPLTTLQWGVDGVVMQPESFAQPVAAVTHAFEAEQVLPLPQSESLRQATHEFDAE